MSSLCVYVCVCRRARDSSRWQMDNGIRKEWRWELGNQLGEYWGNPVKRGRWDWITVNFHYKHKIPLSKDDYCFTKAITHHMFQWESLERSYKYLFCSTVCTSDQARAVSWFIYGVEPLNCLLHLGIWRKAEAVALHLSFRVLIPGFTIVSFCCCCSEYHLSSWPQLHIPGKLKSINYPYKMCLHFPEWAAPRMI